MLNLMRDKLLREREQLQRMADRLARLGLAADKRSREHTPCVDAERCTCADLAQALMLARGAVLQALAHIERHS